MNDATIAALRKLKDENGQYLWQPSLQAGEPDRLFGYEVMKNRIINIDHQLLRMSEMKYVVEATKTNAGTRKLPMTEDVFRCFQAINEDREQRLKRLLTDILVSCFWIRMECH